MKKELEPIEEWGRREGLLQNIQCHIENSDNPTRYILVSVREWAKSKGIDILGQIDNNVQISIDNNAKIQTECIGHRLGSGEVYHTSIVMDVTCEKGDILPLIRSVQTKAPIRCVIYLLLLNEQLSWLPVESVSTGVHSCVDWGRVALYPIFHGVSKSDTYKNIKRLIKQIT